MDLIKIAQETFQIEAEALYKMAERLDQNFLDAIELIMHTKGKLIITGVGKSGLVGAKMAATFASTGTSSFFLHPLISNVLIFHLSDLRETGTLHLQNMQMFFLISLSKKKPAL
jgi:DNA-binding MurR/RpiR family transcriptional regulator